MASRKDIEAGRAHVLLTVKDQLTRGLSMAQATLRGFGNLVRQAGLGMAFLGAAAMAGVVASIKHFADFGSKLNDASERTGVAASKLAEYGYAADQTGSSLEDVVAAIGKAQKAGLDFDKVLERIGNTSDPAEKARLAMEAFGRSGAKLIPMINNLKALREEANAKGLVPTDASVRMADEVGDKAGTIFQQLKMGMFEIGATVAPILLPILDSIQNILASTIQWIRNNAELVTSLGGIGDAIAGGNWGLAGQIAVKQLQIAFQSGLFLIADMLSTSGPLGDAIGTIGTKLIRGDLQGAWDSVVKGMAVAWDGLVLGMVAAFKMAVDNIRILLNNTLDGFKTALTSLAGIITAGVLGAGISNTMAGESALAAAEALRTGAAGVGAIKGTSDDKLGKISSIADIVQDAMFERWLNDLGEHMEDIGGGSKEAGEALAKLNAELRELDEQADKEKRARLAKFSEAPKMGSGEISELAKSSFVTFSASAAAYMGSTGDVARKQREEQIRLAKEGVKNAEILNRKIDRIGNIAAVIA